MFLEILEDENPEKKDLYNYVKKLRGVKAESEIALEAINKKEVKRKEGLIP